MLISFFNKLYNVSIEWVDTEYIGPVEMFEIFKILKRGNET